jgi:hypothetical protein
MPPTVRGSHRNRTLISRRPERITLPNQSDKGQPPGRSELRVSVHAHPGPPDCSSWRNRRASGRARTSSRQPFTTCGGGRASGGWRSRARATRTRLPPRPVARRGAARRVPDSPAASPWVSGGRGAPAGSGRPRTADGDQQVAKDRRRASSRHQRTWRIRGCPLHLVDPSTGVMAAMYKAAASGRRRQRVIIAWVTGTPKRSSASARPSSSR